MNFCALIYKVVAHFSAPVLKIHQPSEFKVFLLQIHPIPLMSSLLTPHLDLVFLGTDYLGFYDWN